MKMSLFFWDILLSKLGTLFLVASFLLDDDVWLCGIARTSQNGISFNAKKIMGQVTNLYS